MHLWSSPFVLLITQTFVIVATARIFGRATQRIGQPLVIAEIVAGIVLGPSILGLLAPSAEAALFPKASLAALSLTSQIGLLLFMFIIGLELHPKFLKGRAHSTVAISHASIALPFLLGGLIGVVVFPSLAPPNISRTSFILFMGAAMSITAFPVLARILAERRLLRSKIGGIAISCAAIDDVTAWCILAFVVSIVRADSLTDALRTVAFALLYIGGMIWIVRPLLERLAGRTRVELTQNIVAAILLAVLASSWLTELIGIHALFGAFLFGAIIPKTGTLAAALTEKIEDVVMVLLLPLFFAYSGLRTQIGLLDTPSSWLTCGFIVLAACVGKFGGSTVAARLTGLSWREASAIGILMNTRGLMELIVLNIGLDLGVISPRLFTMMVVMALVTTFVTTPLLQRIYPMERFARELTDHDAAARTSPAPRFTTVACVSDERSTPGLITLGVANTRGGAPDSRLYALRLVAPNERSSALLAPGPDEEDSDLRADVVLDVARTRARVLNSDLRQLSFVSREPAKDICAVVDVKGANLVLLGWSAGDIPGSVIQGVIAATQSNVGILVDRGLKAIKRILVPFSNSPQDRETLRLAARIAANADARMTVMAVALSPEAAWGSLENAALDVLATTASKSADIVPAGDESPQQALAMKSREGYDVVFMSLGPPWGIERHSFALSPEQVLEGVGCSVVVVRPERRDEADLPLQHQSTVDDTAIRFKTVRPPAA